MDKRKKITNVFISAARSYMDEAKIEGFEIMQGHDVHAFLVLGHDMAIHLQGYPGASDNDQMNVSMRTAKLY